MAFKTEKNSNLPLQAFDQIPQAVANARNITAIVKDKGAISAYQLSDGTIVSKDECLRLAKSGQIAGVGIAHNQGTEYIKSLPDQNANNNLSNLPVLE